MRTNKSSRHSSITVERVPFTCVPRRLYWQFKTTQTRERTSRSERESWGSLGATSERIQVPRQRIRQVTVRYEESESGTTFCAHVDRCTGKGKGHLKRERDRNIGTNMHASCMRRQTYGGKGAAKLWQRIYPRTRKESAKARLDDVWGRAGATRSWGPQRTLIGETLCMGERERQLGYTRQNQCFAMNTRQRAKMEHNGLSRAN